MSQIIRRVTCGGALLAATALSSVADAATVSDPQIEGAKLCTRNLARYEREYGIPMHLLSAISSTESGRYHQGLKMTIPWPWTINVEGEGHYYDSKEEAVAAVKRYRVQGARSIDVGCMQVSLLHHPEAFANLEDAFDPERNVAYGASFLRQLYEENKSWKQASADYHSKTPSRGSEYVSAVYERWTNIIKRLRDAKMEVPTSTMAALNEPSQAVKPVVLSSDTPLPPKRIAVADALPKNMRSNMRMNSISMQGEKAVPVRDQGVLVIRPQIRVVEEGQEMAAVTRHDAPLVQEVAPRVIHVAAARPEAPTPSGPRFIFEN